MTLTPNELVFYDFCNLRYASFYLVGFIKCQEEYGYRFKISREAPRALRAALLDAQWKPLRFAMCVFGASLDGKQQWICVDAHDSNRADHEGRRWGYHLPLLDAVDWYFKVNYNAEKIAADPVLQPYASKIAPIEQFFPLSVPKLPLMARLFASPGAAWTRDDAVQRRRSLTQFPSLNSILDLRRARKDIDVFFVTSFRDQQRHGAARDFRHRIMRALRERRGVSSMTGFASDRPLPPDIADVRAPRLGQRQYLKTLSRARVVIYTRGLHDCLSSRFALFSAIGVAISGQRIVNNASALYRHEHFRKQFFSDDPLEIVERAVALVQDPQEAEMLARLNTETFDRCYTPAAAARTVLRRVGAG